MKKLFYISAMLVFITLVGCDERFYQPDLTPPSVPRGLYAEAGDKLVEIFWNQNLEHDLSGYRIFVSTSAVGKYQYIGSTKQTYFLDKGIPNGQTYYYTVTAYDFEENESPLSREVVSATPRPEGYDIILKDYRTYPDEAGYDFSAYSVEPFDDNYTDVYFENYNGTYYFNVWKEDTEIQDLGYTKSLYEIIEAPTSGWSPTGDVRIIVGHTYVIRTWDYHYTKIRVTSLSSTRVIFDWTYQLQSYNTQLKISVPTVRKPHTTGVGVNRR